MPWIQVDAGIREHDKIFNLADALKITDAHAVGLMVCLWTWAVVAAPDGDITKFPPRAIAKAAGWDKKPEVFFNAICSSDSLFVENVNERIVFRNWEERAALLMDALERGKEQTRKRVQRYREKKAEKNIVTDDADSSDVTDGNDKCNVTSDAGNVTVTNDVTNVTHLPQPQPNQTITTTTTTTVPVLSEHGTTSAASGSVEAADVTHSEPVPFSKIRDLYNSTCTRLSKIKTIEGERRKAVTARYKTYGMEGFIVLFEKAAASNFLCGGGQKNWFATFDWLVNATNFPKVIEGNYDNKPAQSSPSPGTGSKKSRFNNFEGRKIDYTKLEQLEQNYIDKRLNHDGD